MSTGANDCPQRVREFADRAVEHVHGAVGLCLEYDSDTLSLLDHYLGSVPEDQPELAALVAATAGAYFGEVVRRQVGGNWDAATDDPSSWRFILPGGLSFLPVRMALAAIVHDEGDMADPDFRVPPRMRPHLESVLERMGEISEETYYSMCGRFDTIEHVQSVLLAIAANEARKRAEAGEADHLD